MTPPITNERSNDTARRLVRAVFQWWMSGLLFFIIFFSFLMFLAYNLPASYTAKASVLVKSGRENAPDGTATTSEAVKLTASAEDVISEINIMLSRPVLKQVVDDLEGWRSREDVDAKVGFGAKRLGFQNWCRSIGLLVGPQLPNGRNEWTTLREYPKQLRALIEQVDPFVGYPKTASESDSEALQVAMQAVKAHLGNANNWKSLKGLDPIVDTLDDIVERITEGKSISSELVIDFKRARNKNWKTALDKADKEHPKVKAYLEERAIAKLGKLLEIEIVPATHVLDIAYEHESKNASAHTIRFLLDAYLSQHTKIHADGRWDAETGKFELTAGEFFENQSNEFKIKVEGLQAQITEFRKTHDGGDLTRQRDLLVDELIRADQSWRALEAIQGGDEELAAASVLESPEISFYHQKLLDLRLDLARKKGQYTNRDHPDIAEVRNQVDATRGELVEQIKRKHEFLARRVEILRAELKEVEGNRAEYESLIEMRSKAQESWKKYSAKAEEERINQALDLQQVTNIKVLEWPAVPDKPSFPNRFMMALLGIFLGLPAAFAVTLLRAYFNSHISSIVDVEELLNVHVIGSIRRMKMMFAREMPQRVVDAARLVLTSIGNQNNKVIHFASSTEEEGAVTLAAAVAMVGAENESKVVFASESGFPPVIAGIDGITILQLDGLAQDARKKAIDDIVEDADLVIIAGPSLTSGAGGAWASLAETSIFIVSGTGVHIEVARRGLSVLKRYSPDVLGAVLTQRQDSVPGFVYRWT